MESVHLQLPADLLARVDEARKTPLGTVPRNAWIRDAIELYARQAEQTVALASETHEEFLARHLAPDDPARQFFPPSNRPQMRVRIASPTEQPRPKGGKR